MVTKSFCIFLLLTLALVGCSSERVKQQVAAYDNARLGLAYMQQGDSVQARARLLLALRQSPNDPLILDSFAYFLEKTGNVKMAGEYYQRAVALAPKKGEVQNNYGAYLCRQGRYRESLQHFAIASKDINYLNINHAQKNAAYCQAQEAN